MKKALLFLFPLIALLVVRFGLDFNGLYGQDAYEYLRYTARLKEFLSGGPHPGDYFWPLGYPFYGALLSFLVQDVSFALQLVSALGLGGAAVYAVKIPELLFPRKRGIYLYVFLFLLCSPFLLRSALLCMSDCACVFFVTAFFYYAILFRRERKGIHLAVLFFLTGNALMFRYASAVLFVVPAVYLLRSLKKEHVVFILAGLFLFALAVLPHILLRAGHTTDFLGHQWLSGWSFMNYFRSDFITADGTQQYTLPNVVYALGGVFHPGNFAFGVVTLFFLARRGKWSAEERMLLLAVLLYVLFLAGIPFRNYRFFLPALPLIIIPTFGGFLFLAEKARERIAMVASTIVLAAQIALFIYGFRIIYERNRLEQTVASWIAAHASHSTIYSFDIDIALKAYLPGRQFVNLWEKEYETFMPGSLVLFNPSAFEKQWKGKNPMKNWEKLQREGRLHQLHAFGQGWELYELR